MDKNQIFQSLNENICNLETIENEISMVELAIYQKSIEEIKDRKLNEVREFFRQQAILYNQNSEKYQFEINKNIEKIKEQIEKLISVYDNLYLNTFKIMQSAINNQKIAIANIVTLSEGLNKEEITDKEAKNLRKTILACAQKKLNYSIIIEECKARIKWCIDSVQNDINEIFINNMHQLQIYKENIFSKIRRMIYNKISGKSRYKKFLRNYENEYMKDIKLKNKLRILELSSTLKGIIIQMKKVKKQISVTYQQMVNS